MNEKVEDTHLPVTIDSEAVAFKGFRQMVAYDYHEDQSGLSARRELVVGDHAVAVILRDPVLDKLIMVRQFRLGAQIGTGRGMTVEFVAGLIDEGETAEQAAKREVKEETGLNPVRLEPLCRFLTTPGLTSETIDLFYAEADASNMPEVSGHEAENEQTFPILIDFNDAMDAVDDNAIYNGIVMLGLMWFARHRKKLTGQIT